MLDVRTVPLVELVGMRPMHSHVLLGLYRFTDTEGTGICFPGLRRLAKEVSLAVRTLRRALEEMVKLGYLTITKIKRRVNRYEIAARFLPDGKAAVDEPTAEPAAASEAPPTVSLSRTAVSSSRTEGEAKEREEKVLKKEGDLDLGCASAAATNEQPVQTSNMQSPPDERPPATTAAPNRQSTPVEVGAAPAAGPPATDMDAYKAGIKRRKREQWIHKLNGFVMRYFSSDFERMMAFLEVVTRANNAVHDWASLSKDDHKTIDWLDEHMRNWEAPHAIARAA